MSDSGVWNLDIAGSGSGSGSEINNRLKTLEETIHEYEIYHLITEGTTGSVEKPTHGDIIMDQYPAGGDCIIVKTDSTTQKPIEALVYDASGVLVEGTLDINGNYILSGVPTIYPVALVFQVSLAEMYKTLELSNDRILTEMQIPNAGVTSHEDLSNINQAGTGVVNGHISDQAQTIAGAKTFSDTIIGSINGNADTVTNGVYTIDDQTITGVKTFNSSPIIPDATTATQAVSKGQLDTVDFKTTPVDCTSRVAEYTGDGIPLIPDSVDGRTYFQDEWATTDGWSGSGASVSVANGRLVIAKTGASQYATKTFGSDFNPQTCILRIRVASGTLYLNRVTMDFRVSNGTYLNSLLFTVPSDGTWVTVNKYLSSPSARTIWIYPGSYESATQATIEIEVIYIGTGAYDTPTLDRAGNGNSLALTAVTPVNGKFGKEMSFNGSTSFAQASSPVIGTTGTIAIRFKINSTSKTYVLLDTRNGSTALYGIAILVASNTLAIRYAGATTQNFNLASGIGTGYRDIEISFDTTNIYFYLDGVLVSTTPITVSGFSHTNNLLVGKCQSTTTFPLNGIISHFRYDSRIWTAVEARAWSLNPSVEDSIGFSATPEAGKAMVWPDSGFNADTSDKWKTARNITISDADGTNTGSAVSVDGSENETLKLPATIKANVTGNVTGNADTATAPLYQWKKLNSDLFRYVAGETPTTTHYWYKVCKITTAMTFDVEVVSDNNHTYRASYRLSVSSYSNSEYTVALLNLGQSVIGQANLAVALDADGYLYIQTNALWVSSLHVTLLYSHTSNFSITMDKLGYALFGTASGFTPVKIITQTGGFRWSTTEGITHSNTPIINTNIIGNLTGEASKIPFATKTGTSTGTQGQASFDANYLYLCTATDVWKRVALSSF